MDQTLFAIPILPGKSEAARAVLREMDGPRKPHLAASDQALGIVREVWSIQQTPQGDLLLGYLPGRTAASPPPKTNSIAGSSGRCRR